MERTAKMRGLVFLFLLLLSCLLFATETTSNGKSMETMEEPSKYAFQLNFVQELYEPIWDFNNRIFRETNQYIEKQIVENL